MEPLKPLDLPSIHDEIQERIKEYILVNKLQPDDPLPSETQIADQLGVSRAVVREALRSLESLGVIHSRRGAGRYVSEFNLDPIIQNLGYSMLLDMEDVQEILEVRERLEAGFIADAIAAMDQDTLSQLWTLVDKMRQKAAAGETFPEEDLAFHRTIYLTTGNRLLIKLLGIFWDVYNNLLEESLDVVEDPDAEARNHEAILQAIEAKEVKLAQDRITDHFDGIKERLRTARLGTEAVLASPVPQG